MSTSAFFSLSNFCQYLTLYRLFVLKHYVQCCPLQSVDCLSTSHCNIFWLCVSLCPLLPSTVCPLSVSIPHTIPSVASVSLCPLLPSTVCQYVSLYRLLFLCHYVHFCLLQSVHCLQYVTLLVLCYYVHCCLLQSVHCLSVYHTVPSVGSLSLCHC